jgi:hypothetical protein
LINPIQFNLVDLSYLIQSHGEMVKEEPWEEHLSLSSSLLTKQCHALPFPFSFSSPFILCSFNPSFRPSFSFFLLFLALSSLSGLYLVSCIFISYVFSSPRSRQRTYALYSDCMQQDVTRLGSKGHARQTGLHRRSQHNLILNSAML